ncbi:MAG: LCP family protein [Terrisporobacter sp.]
MTKLKRKIKIRTVVLCLLVLLVSIPVFAFYSLYNRVDSSSSQKAYESKYEKIDGVTNVLLLGTDGRQKELAYRSDCMMIATLDANNKNIKLTSLARDTYVDIPGKGKGKLNAAYFWGKEDLLFQTIEENFEIKLDKFVQVDFNDLTNIVNILGGVEVDVKEHEIEVTNDFIPYSYDTCSYENKGEMQFLTSPGKQKLNGYQTIAYTRIRITDSAINRDERQRVVIMSMLDTIKQMDISKYSHLLNSILPYISTNLTPTDVLNLGFTATSTKAFENIKEGQFPIIDNVHVKGGNYKDAGWVWLYDLNSEVVLRDFINKDINMKDHEYLKNNSNVSLNY